jgi:hypothetical protein
MALLRHQRRTLLAMRAARSGGAQLSQLAEHRDPALPLLELYRPQPMAQPFVHLAKPRRSAAPSS